MIMAATRPPEAERARLEALGHYGVLDTPPEQAFDDLARLAALVCEAPMAQINFVAAARQWSKAAVGGPRAVMPRGGGLCAHAIERAEPLVVDGAVGDDGHLAGLALAYGDPTVRFYAGVPLVTPDGHAIGTLCVLDHEPRELTSEQREALTALSRLVLTQLEVRRSVHTPARGSGAAAAGGGRADGDARERDETFRRLARAVSEGMGVTVVVDGCIVAANNAFGKMFGYEGGEVIGLELSDFIALRARDADGRDAAAPGERPREARARRKDGSTFDVE